MQTLIIQNVTLTSALKLYQSSDRIPESWKEDVKSKATGVIQDGLFPHHKSFYYIDKDGVFWYRDFFGQAWHKRRPDKQGWVKYQNALAFNIHSKKLVERRDLEKHYAADTER